MEPATVESRMRRLKPIWRFMLISNLALGAYMFAKARQKNMRKERNKSGKKRKEDAKAREEVFGAQPSITPEVLEPLPLPSQPVAMVGGEPIPEDQQRELFQWMLEEKGKVEPKDGHEKKLIDQEKALIKQFIRADSCISYPEALADDKA